MTPINNKIAITYTSESSLEKAKDLSLKLNLPIIDNKKPFSFPLLLIFTEKRLELKENSTKKTKPIYVDFLSPKLRYRTQHGGKKKELIAKAIGIKSKKHPFVIDATAGFGTDSFILASLGCHVLMLERSPIIGALLKDGLERLNKDPNGQLLKITLKIVDSLSYIKRITEKELEKPDVIYLDPMYPERTKSALNKKTMRVLSEIVGEDLDAPKLLKAALKRVKNRVVVKRPRHSDYLGKLKPDLELSSGQSSRYDIYFIKNGKKE